MVLSPITKGGGISISVEIPERLTKKFVFSVPAGLYAMSFCVLEEAVVVVVVSISSTCA